MKGEPVQLLELGAGKPLDAPGPWWKRVRFPSGFGALVRCGSGHWQTLGPFRIAGGYARAVCETCAACEASEWVFLVGWRP